MNKFKWEHIVLSEEETETFGIWLECVVELWLNEVCENGIDGRALVVKARKLIAKCSQ